jgi:prophage antirepressor-like protein
MTDIQNFWFEDSGDRWEVRFVGTSDVPEWVASDVVDVLYPAAARNQNHSTYLSKVPAEWKGSKPVATLGGEQMMTTLYESGLYYLITRSDSSRAIPFQRWVFEDVLPSIRKTGRYAHGFFADTSAMVVLKERRERLEIIQLGMDLFSQLGGIDERTEVQVKDLVRDIVLADQLKKPALPGSKRLEYPISDRVVDLGYGVQSLNILKRIGQIASNLYKARHGTKPVKREQFVDGTTRQVNLYSEDDLDILDAAIKRVLDEPPQSQ